MKIAIFITRRDNEVVSSIIKGIHQCAKENNIDVFVFYCNGSFNFHNLNTVEENEIFGLPLLSDFNGVILVSLQIQLKRVLAPLYAEIERTGVPAISIEEESENISAVGCNIYQAMSDLVNHLIVKHEVKSICYIAGYDNYESNTQLEAVKKVTEGYGINLHESMIIRKKVTFHDGTLVGKQLYDIFGKKGLPDAIICANDEIAMGIIDYFEYFTDDVRVPDDLVVTGFYHKMTGAHHFTPLTTVECDFEGIGYEACKTLLKKINNEQIVSIYRDAKLIKGRSCGCRKVDKNKIFDVYKRMYLIFKEGEHFKEIIDEMSEVLVSAKSKDEFMKHLKIYIPFTKVDEFYLMLADSEVHVERNKHNINNAFDYILDVPMIWKNNEFTALEGMETRNLLPDYEQSNGDLYLFYPIHYQEQARGYCIFKNAWYMLFNDYLVPFMETLNTSLEICNQRNRLVKVNDQLNRLYVKDSLTGLLNRFGYEKEAASLFMDNNKKQKTTMVAFIDLDRLKYINDTFGHDYGDISILGITGIMKRTFPSDFVKVRFGGDEFVVFGECPDEETADSYIQQIMENIERSKETNIFPFEIGASIGYVLTDYKEEKTLSEYVQEADQKMYAKKLQRKAERNLLHEKDDRL